MPFPPISIISKVYHPGLDAPQSPMPADAKSGYEQKITPLNLRASMSYRIHPFLPQNTNISSRGILPVSTVPGQFLVPVQMTDQPVAAMCPGIPTVPHAIPLLKPPPHSMNTLAFAQEPSMYDLNSFGSIPPESAHQNTTFLNPFHGEPHSQMPPSLNTLPTNNINPYKNCVPVPLHQIPDWPSSQPVELIPHEKGMNQGFESKALQCEATMAKVDRGTEIKKKVYLNPKAAEFVPKALKYAQKEKSDTDDSELENAFDSNNGAACPFKNLLGKDNTPNAGKRIDTEYNQSPVNDCSILLQHKANNESVAADFDTGAVCPAESEVTSEPVLAVPVQCPEADDLNTVSRPSSVPAEADHPESSFSVQQVLQLRHPGTTRKTPYALKLLYLDSECFDFHQKIRINEGFDEKGNRIKLSPSELKKQHKTLQNQLRESGSKVKLPPLYKMKTQPSSKTLLTSPTTYANIYPLSRQISHAAARINQGKFIEREKVRISLATNLASHTYSAEHIRQMKEMAKDKVAIEFTEKLETDDLYNIDLVNMFYYPYFDQRVFTLEAPFIRSVETIYCRPRLSDEPLRQHGSKHFDISAEELSQQENTGTQLIQTPRVISALAKSLITKLEQQEGEDNPANVLETFSRQCIQWHIQFTCDLVYKMIKLGEEDTQNIRERLADTLEGLLDSINALSGYFSKFPDEFKMLAESLCFLLQSRSLQHLLSLQEGEVLSNIKTLLHDTIAQLEKAILLILLKSLQCPELLNTTMSLLRTISDHKMFLTTQASRNNMMIIRLARFTSEFADNLLRSLKNHYLDDISIHNPFVQQLHSCCVILEEVHQKVIQKAIPDHAECQRLGACIKIFDEACRVRLTEIEQAREQYLKGLESEKQHIDGMLKANIEKHKQSKQKQEARKKRNDQLKKEIARGKAESMEKKEPESEHSKRVNGMSNRLQLFSKKLEHGENYANELETISSEFPEVLQSTVLAVWVYGDLAYNLCIKCAEKFNRAIIFIREFEKMKSFCVTAHEEAAKRPQKYDSKWLYDRDPNQPASIGSIEFLLKLSDPEQIQALIKRAFDSVSLYETALKRARDAAHQLTQDMLVGAVNAENDMQMYHLRQRVAFIIEEMNDVKQYLKDLQPVPDMSDLLETRKQLFKMLKTKGVTGGTDGNQSKETKSSVYESLLEKSEIEWKVDSSVCDMRNSAEQQLEQVIKGFTELKTQLGPEGSRVYTKSDWG